MIFRGTRVAQLRVVQPLPRLQDAQRAATPAVVAKRAACTQVEPHRIVAIGGGTGLPAVLEGLCGSLSDEEAAHRDSISAIVTMTDNGGSSGRLREAFGILPPGDVRNCLAAAAASDSPFRELLQHRFSSGGELEGHAVGNLLLTALTRITGSFPAAVEHLGGLMRVRASVLPSTCQDVHLVAEMESGLRVIGETAIVASGERIKKLSLHPHARPLPEVLRAIVNADGIVVGPGSLYSSILPNLLVDGVAATISGVTAVRIYVANLMTEPGETDHYTLDDHLRVIREHVGFDLFDYILVNSDVFDSPAVARYAAQGAEPVMAAPALRWAGRAKVVEGHLAGECDGRKIRHSPGRLARAIRELVTAGRAI